MYDVHAVQVFDSLENLPNDDRCADIGKLPSIEFEIREEVSSRNEFLKYIATALNY